MSNLLGLIVNEHMKIFRRLSTWIMVILLLSSILLTAIVIKLYFDTTNENWQSSLVSQNEMYEQQLESDFLRGQSSYIQMQYDINEYRIVNDIPPINTATLWGFMEVSYFMVLMIILFIIIIAASSVASEFSWGTIKLLLIRPAARTKILLSKYLSTLMFAIYFLLLLFCFSFIVGLIFFDSSTLTDPHLSYVNGEVVERSMVVNILSSYAFESVDLIMMVTFAFMISSVFRSSSLAIGLAMFLLFVGGNVTVLLFQFEWAKFILFANTDLRMYFDGTPPIESMTLGFSIIVLAVYFLAMNFLSWIVFTKRDVSA